MPMTISRRNLLRASAGIPLAASAVKAANARTNTATPEVGSAPLPRSLARMSPQPGTKFALPHTSISLRDVDPAAVGTLRVSGSVSGPAAGILREHRDGNGISWIADAPFLEAETVTVTADIPLTELTDGSATFEIGRQSPRTPAFYTEDRDSATGNDELVQSFRSRPDLVPIQIDVRTIDEARVTPGLMAVTPHVPNGHAGAQLVNNAGETVWFHNAADTNHVIYCLNMQIYNNEPVLTWWEGARYQGWGYGHFVMMNREYETIGHVQAGNGVNGLDVHDMQLTPYGTAWAFSYHSVWVNHAGIERNVAECVIQEIDIETGDVWWEWHSLDHVAIGESYSPIPKDPDSMFDYIHINSIDVDLDGNLLISSRGNHTIYKIDTTTHDVIWRLGGKHSDFEMTEDAVFHWQHDARRLADGTFTLFDNHDDTEKTSSRGMVFDLDEASMTATLTNAYYHPEEMWSPYQANMQTLDNGHVFIGWGSGPRCSEYTPEGEMIFDMRYRGGQSYRGYRIDWNATPNRPIDYLLEDAMPGTLTCHASWNGATNVTTWRVLAGADASTAVEVTREPKVAFETALSGIPTSAYMEVQALDAAGMILAGRILNRGA